MAFTLKSLIHLKLILMCAVHCFPHSFLFSCFDFSVEKTFPPWTLNYMSAFVKNQLAVQVWSVSEPPGEEAAAGCRAKGNSSWGPDQPLLQIHTEDKLKSSFFLEVCISSVFSFIVCKQCTKYHTVLIIVALVSLEIK